MSRLKDNIEATVKESLTVQDQLTSAIKQRGLYQEACKVLSLTGIRAHVLDMVTPYLNERTAYYSNVLSDGALQVTWSTLTRNSKGELREKFSIVVENDTGARSFDCLSGGEKRKVRLACAFALHDFIVQRAAEPISLFVADEIDDALDTAGLERLMTILEEKTEQCGTVMVISHNDLKHWIPNVITVIKEDGKSFLM